MTFLSDSELAQLRLDVLDTLPDTCRVERPTSSNTSGYVTEAWGTAVASAACRFDPLTTRERPGVIAERESSLVQYTVTLAYNTDVRDGDRLVFNGQTYEVARLWEDHSAHAVRRADVTRIRGG